MNDNFNNDKWTEKAVWIKKEPLSSDAVLSEVRADIEHLIGYVNITLDLMEREKEDKRIIRKSEIMQLRQLCNKVDEHFR